MIAFSFLANLSLPHVTWHLCSSKPESKSCTIFRPIFLKLCTSVPLLQTQIFTYYSSKWSIWPKHNFKRKKILGLGSFMVKFRTSLKIGTVYTVPTQNSDIFQNSDTLFALTKMSLFWQQEDFGKNTLIFFKHWAEKNSFFIFENCVKLHAYAGMDLRFFGQTLVLVFGN